MELVWAKLNLRKKKWLPHSYMANKWQGQPVNKEGSLCCQSLGLLRGTMSHLWLLPHLGYMTVSSLVLLFLFPICFPDGNKLNFLKPCMVFLDSTFDGFSLVLWGFVWHFMVDESICNVTLGKSSVTNLSKPTSSFINFIILRNISLLIVEWHFGLLLSQGWGADISSLQQWEMGHMFFLKTLLLSGVLQWNQVSDGNLPHA